MNLGNSERLALCADHLRRAQQEIHKAEAILGGCRRTRTVDRIFKRVREFAARHGDRRWGPPHSPIEQLIRLVTKAQEIESGRSWDHG